MAVSTGSPMTYGRRSAVAYAPNFITLHQNQQSLTRELIQYTKSSPPSHRRSHHRRSVVLPRTETQRDELADYTGGSTADGQGRVVAGE